MTDPRDPDPTVERERTTVVHTEGGRGGGGAIAFAVILLLVLFLLFIFRDEIFGAAQEVEPAEVDVEVSAPANSG